ncbi:complement factor B-like [Emydura macquarii macquarii]|uniref:complement factor B-like n=1 Tax=Emydura macquarii macquarii TaxID=1129001 RepID=UPI003529F0E9
MRVPGLGEGRAIATSFSGNHVPFPLASLRFQKPKYQLPAPHPPLLPPAWLHKEPRSPCCSDSPFHPQDPGVMEHAPSLFLLLLLLLRHCLCDVVCGDAESIQGGEVVYPTIRANGSVLEYHCPPNSRAHPVSWRVCQSDGTWSPLRNAFGSAQRPSCINYTCPGNIIFENGWHQPRRIKYNVGDTINFQCEPGHRIFGSASRTCLANGEWSGRTAVCDPKESLCPWPGIPIGGRRQGHVFEPGKAVTFTCLQGLVLRGSPRRVCQSSGQWSGEEPRCEGHYAYDNWSSVAVHLDMSEEIILHAHTGTNIYFALHASASIGAENLQMSGEFMFAIMKQAMMVSEKIYFAAVAFASSAQLVSVLTKEPTEVERAWEQVQNMSSLTPRGTNMGAALKQVLSLIQKEPPRKKPWKHIVVLLTSGRHNMGLNPAGVSAQIQAAVPDPDQNLDIFALGIGDADKEQLEQIATKKPGTQRSFYLQSYRDLRGIAQLVGTAGEALGCGVRGVGHSPAIQRIYGGEQAAEKQWPWQVYLSITDKDMSYSAGGSIIAPSWILTAAHNIWDTEARKAMAPENVHVAVGQITAPKKTPRGAVGQIIIHEEYKGLQDFDFDIALLNLTRPLPFSSTVRPVCLPCSAETSRVLDLPEASWEERCQYQGRILTGHDSEEEEREIRGIVTGWGKTTSFSKARKLQQAEVVIQSRLRCQQSLPKFTPNMFCAVGEKGQDACQGDSGGPFVVNRKQHWIQVGIVSHGTNDSCDGKQLGVYTSVPRFMGWIRKKVPELGFE